MDSLFSMGVEFLQEVLMSIKTSDLGLLFLVYDCQHFSESIITKSLNILIKYSGNDTQNIINIYQNLFNGFLNLELDDIESLDH